MIVEFIALYVVGICISAGAMGVIGERNPNTTDGSVTGDPAAEIMLMLLWPVFWLYLGTYHLVRRLWRS